MGQMPTVYARPSHGPLSGVKRSMDEEAIEIAIKLPPEFVALSLDTHQKFDALGLEAARGGTKIGALKQLDEILANCTACHATFRLSSR